MKNLTPIIRKALISIWLGAEIIWRWWLQEMKAILPENWTARDAVTAEWDGHQFTFRRHGVTFQNNGELGTIAGTVKLAISGDALLRRTVRLPLTARFQLQKILNHEIERQSPVDPRLMLFTYRIVAVDRTRSTLLISMALIRRATISSALTELSQMGLRVADVRTADLPGLLQDKPIMVQRNQLRMGSSQVFSWLSVLLVLILLAGDFAVRVSRQQTGIRDIARELVVLNPQLREVSIERNQLRREQNIAIFLRAQRLQPSFGRILAEITRLLPDGTWLISVSFDGQIIDLQGYSSNAAGLVVLFDNSRLFKNAVFRSAITAGPNPNQQQFDLTFGLAENS